MFWGEELITVAERDVVGGRCEMCITTRTSETCWQLPDCQSGVVFMRVDDYIKRRLKGEV